MCKIIKKRIKRSFPALMILILLSQAFVALAFNFSFNDRLSNSIEFIKEARADSATSSVTVRNAPPEISDDPEENPISSSTSPINVGGSIPFTMTADDPEGNDYYLIVCSSDSVSPGAGGGTPTCGDVKFCSSVLTDNETQATCTYTGVADPIPTAETDAWYAFACDNHATEADCSEANQGEVGGTGSGSPIYINHAPTIASVSTTVNNQNPGGTFTMEAAATDGDSQGGTDDLIISVCTTDSWSLSTGCAATTLCIGTSTAPDVSCQFTDTAPTPHGANNYYAFVKDWHSLAATGNSKTSTYTINNMVPEVTGIALNNSAIITLTAKLAPEVAVYATSTSVVDYNGCTDIVDATSTVYMSNASGLSQCSASDSDCYKIANTACNISDCSGDSDTTATVVCSTTLAFYAIPTDDQGDNPYEPYNWRAYISVYDGSTSGTSTSAGVELAAAAALEVDETTIDYDIIQAGQNSGTVNATTTILNYGNTPLDNQISGTWMTKGGDSIGENNQKFDLSNFSWAAGTYTLSSTTPQAIDIVVARPTDESANFFDEVLWGINIPGATPSGEYSGTNLFQAILDTVGGNWN